MANFISKLIAGEVGNALPTSLMGVRIDPKILSFRENVLNDPGERRDLEAGLKEKEQAQQESIGQLGPEDFYPTFQQNISTIEGIKSRAAGLKAIRLDRFVVNLEDADTFVLKRRGILNSIKSMFGYGDVQVRLAGIDAPEVASHSGDPLAAVRIFQNQPYGEEAADRLKEIIANQDKLSLLVSTGNQTYGRYLGVATGDNGLNINLEEVRQGIASALPFGPRSEDIVNRTTFGQAEDQAYQNRQGMWGYARYRAARQANQEIGSPITWNTLTRLDKTAGNLNLGAYSSFLEGFGDQQRDLTAEEVSTARRIGRTLSKNYGPRANQAFNKIPGKDDAYNRIEGLKHGGMAQEMRRSMTDFGSGWRGLFSRLIRPFTFAGKVESGYKRIISQSLRQQGISTRNISWDILSEQTKEGLAFTAVAKKEGKLLAGMSRLFGKQEIDLTQIEVAQNLSGVGKELYRQESLLFRRLGYRPGTKVTSSVSNPITARWQTEMYGSQSSRMLDSDFRSRLANKQISKIEFQEKYAGEFVGRLPRLNKASNPNRGFSRGWFSDQKELNTDFTNKGCWLKNVVSKAWRSISKQKLNFAKYEDVANVGLRSNQGVRFGAKNIAKLSDEEFWAEVVPEVKKAVMEAPKSKLKESISRLPKLYDESIKDLSQVRREFKKMHQGLHMQSKSNLVSSMKKSPGRNHVSNSAASPKGTGTVKLKMI